MPLLSYRCAAPPLTVLLLLLLLLSTYNLHVSMPIALPLLAYSPPVYLTYLLTHIHACVWMPIPLPPPFIPYAYLT